MRRPSQRVDRWGRICEMREVAKWLPRSARVCVCMVLGLKFLAPVIAGDTKVTKNAKNDLPMPGESFLVHGRVAFLIASKRAAASKSKPWVWYAPTLPELPGDSEKWMFEKFIKAGISI